MTTYPRLIYNNRWRKGVMGTPTTEDPQDPASDSQIDTLSMSWRTTNDTDDPTLIPCNLGGAYEINFVALLGHNIPDTATIYFEGADDAAFAGPDLVTVELTHNATNIFEFITPFTKTWVRVRITTPGNADNYIEIATILCGSYVEFNRRPIKDYVLGKEDVTEIEETDSRVIFAQEKDVLNEYRYGFEALDNATEVIILAFLEECRKNRGFVWCTDYSAPNTTSIFVRNTEIIYPVFQYPDFWNWEIAMREIV